MKYENYSVLMSVYYKEKAENLQESIKSIYNQTIPTNNFVLVCDGPLTEELNSIIDQSQKLFGKRLTVCRLDQNQGLGKALNYGLKHCANELVARMDSDDIAISNRCEKQMLIFNKNPDLSLVSGTVLEFSKNINDVTSKRELPIYNREIIKFSKRRTPFNHPCIMFKKSAVIDVGGYQDFYLLEDYYLWIRLLSKNYQGFNIREPLLYMRAGEDMYKRRSGIKYVRSQIKLFQYMLSINYINTLEFFFFVLERVLISTFPNKLRTLCYRFLVRGKI